MKNIKYQSNFSLIGRSSNVSIIKLLMKFLKSRNLLLLDLFLGKNLWHDTSLTDDKLSKQSFNLFILRDSENKVSVCDPELATWKANIASKWYQLLCEVLENGSEGNTRIFWDSFTESALSHQSCHSWHWKYQACLFWGWFRSCKLNYLLLLT